MLCDNIKYADINLEKSIIMKKQPELTTKTKKALQDSFWDIYCIKKIEHITVKEITEKAGYNRGTFYVYFNDIYDVLSQIESYLLSYIETIPSSITIEMIDPKTLIEQFSTMYEKNAEYLCILLSENGEIGRAHV